MGEIESVPDWLESDWEGEYWPVESHFLDAWVPTPVESINFHQRSITHSSSLFLDLCLWQWIFARWMLSGSKRNEDADDELLFNSLQRRHAEWVDKEDSFSFTGQFFIEKIRFLSPLLCKNPSSNPPPPPYTKSIIWLDVAISPPSYRWFSEWHSIWSLQARSSRLSPGGYIFRTVQHRTLWNTQRHKRQQHLSMPSLFRSVWLNKTWEQQLFTLHNAAASKVQQKVE